MTVSGGNSDDKPVVVKTPALVFARENARALQRECSYSSAKSNELTDLQDLFGFNHASASYTNKKSCLWITNSRHKTLNSTLPCFRASRVLSILCNFGQSARSIESMCVVWRYTRICVMNLEHDVNALATHAFSDITQSLWMSPSTIL